MSRGSVPPVSAAVSYTHLDVYKRQVSDNEAYTVNASEVESDGDKVKFGGKSYSIESEAGNNSIAVYFTNIEGDEYSTCLLYTSRCV